MQLSKQPVLWSLTILCLQSITTSVIDSDKASDSKCINTITYNLYDEQGMSKLFYWKHYC